ncbi:trafficking protein particle complex subunit 13 [Tribolium castaneum]|uniref:Putative trafficking protein particle complex subunit 13 homolog-like Protein n=1 Tax=Tribolium castaneum TaxID=7070 RepID=D6WTU7_TRICA|nr:PREDICTED: trafficking protein particle complex subunit 13 [Tribolium castaneum]EFA07324.1 putative trafficking protein particle complex subunit 13 homolog-like Protein [Tribolium castaneum]|eukprot:XP_967297.1 PREDICTED: trafficking protein particle complex subunit 13 [Tribolium castaneum]
MEPEEHLLALKVMRLTRPTLATPLPVTCDSKDLPGNLLNVALQQDAASVKGTETLSIGQFLLLPQSPVNIYLGETFSSYICVYNETQHIVSNVSVKVDLQTTSQRLPLSSNPPTPQLTPDDTVNIVIHHEVKEIGNHILVCEVSYQNAVGILKSFRKFFKIQVLKPLDVKTKFYNAENDDVYLEAQVQNITTGPICLEKVALDASHLFKVTSLNVTPTGESIFGKTTLLNPQAVCQFLYCLSPNEKLSSDLKSLSGATNIGKLDIVWRSNLGERGRLQTSQLQRMGPDYGDIRLSITELPNFVVLEELFAFKCRLVNNCERSVELMMYLDNSDGLAWCGISGRKLEVLPPHSTRVLEFKAIPLIPGLRTLSGIKLVDTFLKRTYNYDDLGQVFVIVNDNVGKSI